MMRGTINPMPPPEKVLEMPKMVPEKLGERSRYDAKCPDDSAPLKKKPEMFLEM